VLVSQDLSGDTQDHCRMTINQGRERALVTLVYEAFEQLGVRQPTGRARPEECFYLPKELH
jgi:hypothetical protein